MTDEQITQFAMAGGWTLESDGLWIPPFDRNQNYRLPDFLTDLQACFDVLERVSKKWHLSTIVDDAECGIAGPHYNLMIEDFIETIDIDICAATKQECIILAVLAAGGK